MITKRARSWLLRGFTAGVVVVVIVVVVGTWITTERIDALLLEVDPQVLPYEAAVLGVGESSVTLERTAATEKPGVWGLEWESGHAWMGRVLDASDDLVTRELVDRRGILEAGDLVAIDPFVYESDPGDLGIPFGTVLIEGPLGNYPAWRLEGSDDTWVIFVHGQGSSRREALRLAETVAEMAFPSLVVTYRNDPAAPASPNRRYSLGKHEWRDLEAAAEYAFMEGATDLVLVGYGMGGGIASTFVRESEWGGRVRAMILDSPLLDGGIVVDEDTARTDVPGFIVALAKGLAALRYGVDWGLIDQIGHADELEIPILLFHGDADLQIPVRSSDRFAEAAEAAQILLRYERVPGAGHGESWNVDPLRYEAAVRTFLNANARGPSDLDPVSEDTLEELDASATGIFEGS